MQIRIDQKNFLELDLNNGGRIIKLMLDGHVIIKSDEPISDLGSGMFLMFPWISKVPQNPYNPALKCQYHGFVMNTKRQIQIKKESQELISFSLKEIQARMNQHNFIQNYRLSRGRLQIQFKVIQNQLDKLPFCFGYHPYLQIDDLLISDMIIKSDIATMIKFDQNTLPIYPFIQQKVELSSSKSYNNLFKGGSFVQLITKDNVHLRVQSNLPFWQIYTPSQNNKIAIQPASFCGNLYQIYNKDSSIDLPTSGKIQFSIRGQ